MSPPRRWRTLARLRERGVELVRSARVDSFEDGRISYYFDSTDTAELLDSQESQKTPTSTSSRRSAEAQEPRDCERHAFDADTVLIAGGWLPDASLAHVLAERDIEAHSLGDCRSIGQIEGAIADAGRLARSI